MSHLSTLTLAELRKEYNLQARMRYAAADGSGQAERIQARLDALKAEAARRGKDIRPVRRTLR